MSRAKINAGTMDYIDVHLSHVAQMVWEGFLGRDDDAAAWTSDYGLVVVDECHHVPAAAFEHAVRQIPARRWLGLTATPYRRDQLDDLIALQLGPIRHTPWFKHPPEPWAAAHQTPQHPSRSCTSTPPVTATPATPIPPHPAASPPSTAT